MSAQLTLYASTLLMTFLAGVLPLLNCEAYLFLLAATQPASLILPLAVVSAAGQMAAKGVLYACGRGLPARWRFVDALRVRFAKAAHGAVAMGSGTVFVSAVSGLPPFYPLSVLAGTVRFPLARFLALGFAGRVIRFAAVLSAPALLTHAVPHAALALLVGAVAGTLGVALRPLAWRPLLRTLVVGVAAAASWQAAAALDLSQPSGRVVLLGLAWATQAALVAVYETLRGRSRGAWTSWLTGLVAVLLLASMAGSWRIAADQAPVWLVVLAVASIAGWLTAAHVALRLQGRLRIAAVRAPLLALPCTALLACFSLDPLHVVLGGLGYAHAITATWRALRSAPSSPAPTLWQHGAMALHAALWIVIVGHVALALSGPGLLAAGGAR